VPRLLADEAVIMDDPCPEHWKGVVVEEAGRALFHAVANETPHPSGRSVEDVLLPVAAACRAIAFTVADVDPPTPPPDPVVAGHYR